MREETGLAVDVGPMVEVLDRVRRAPDGAVEHHFVIIDYVCRVRSGRPMAASDADDVRWVPLGDVRGYGLTEKAHDVIRKATEMIWSATQSTPARRGER